jgi:hypothetical protein
MSQVFQAIIAAIVTIIRKVPASGGWHNVRVPHVGDVEVHRVDTTLEYSKGVNEVWIRFKGETYRGSAETIAKELAHHRRAPSKAVAKVVNAIEAKWFTLNPARYYGFSHLKEPEIAAWLGLDEEMVFKAMDHLEKTGYAAKNDVGEWVRLSGS